MSYRNADRITLTQYDFIVIEGWMEKHKKLLNMDNPDYEETFGINEFIMDYKGSSLIRYEEGELLTKKKNYKIPKDRYDKFMKYDKDKINMLNGFSNNSFSFISNTMLEKYLKSHYDMINTIYRDKKLSKKQKFINLLKLGCVEIEVYVRLIDRNEFSVVILMINEKLDIIEMYDEIPSDETEIKGDIIKENLFRIVNAIRYLLIYTHNNMTYLDKFVRSTTYNNRKNNRTGERNKYRLNRKYSLNRIVRFHYTNRNENPTRRNNAYVQEWSVRGHWRKYKSGKKVWIKPHRCERPEESGATEKFSRKEYQLELSSHR